MDLQRSLRTVIATGKVHLGADQTVKAIEKGEAKLVILARNSPQEEQIKTAANAKNVQVHDYPGLGTALGPACGKPFSISALCILDAGESDILQLK